MKRPEILIVEDSPESMERIEASLSSEDYQLHKVVSIDKAKRSINEFSIDLILLDLRLQDGSGLDFLELIRQQNDLLPVIIISSISNLQTLSRAFNIGSDDYIIKPFQEKDLLARVKRALKRHLNQETGKIELIETIQQGDMVLNLQSKTLQQKHSVIKLRQKHFEMLLLFFQNPETTISKDLLLSSLWPQESAELNTLTVHIHQVRKILGTKKDGTEFIETVHGMGYRFNPADD